MGRQQRTLASAPVEVLEGAGVESGRPMMTKGGKKDEAVLGVNEAGDGDEPGGAVVVEGQVEVVHPASSMIFHGTGTDHSCAPMMIPMAKEVKFAGDEASGSCRLDP